MKLDSIIIKADLLVKAKQMEKENGFLLNHSQPDENTLYLDGIETGIKRIIKLIERQ